MKTLIHIITGIFLFISQQQIFSQSFIGNDETVNSRAYIRTGIEPALYAAIGFEHNYGLTIFNKPNVSFIEIGFYIKGYEIKLGDKIPLFERKSFKIINTLNGTFGNINTKHFNSKKLAIADELAIGFYKEKWFFALTSEYENIYLIHLKHTAFYREHYYEDVVDGWYKNTGGMFQFGIEGGRTIKQKIDIHMELKVPFTETFNGYGGSPLHVNLGIGYRF